MSEQNEYNMVNVFSPEMEWQGDIIVQELKDNGIDAYLANRTTNNIWGGEIPFTKLEILVPEAQESRAKELIDSFLSKNSVEPLQDNVLPEGEDLKENEEPQV